MACDKEVLKDIPLFALLDDEETAVLAGQVELKKFTARERIYKMGDSGGPAYVMLSGKVRVTTIDQDQQDVLIDVLLIRLSRDLLYDITKQRESRITVFISDTGAVRE